MSLISPTESHQFTKGKLTESSVAAEPVEQFHAWFKEAVAAGIESPEAMSLATAELPSGRVSVRTVLMKEVDTQGHIVVYSNWEHSRKASDLRSNPNVAVSFWWKELERCVRVEGKAVRMTREESQVYYQTRPRGSQVGAWASKQSQPLQSREVLEKVYNDIDTKHKDEEKLPCPPFWGGIRIEPERWEFWQGRASRIHDRIEYYRSESDKSSWTTRRLNP